MAKRKRPSSTSEISVEKGFVTFTENVSLDKMPKKWCYAFEQAIELIQKYKLPCNVVIDNLPLDRLAVHRGLTDGIRFKDCEIVLSGRLVGKGDETSIRRRIIHECAHHLAVPQSGHG